MSTGNTTKPAPFWDLAKIVVWGMAVVGAFVYLSVVGLLVSASENWLLLVLVGALALMIAGPLDLGLGLSSLFRNDPDRPSFWSRSLFGGLGATFLVIMVWSVIFFCDTYILPRTNVRSAESEATQHVTPAETEKLQTEHAHSRSIYAVTLPAIKTLFQRKLTETLAFTQLATKLLFQGKWTETLAQRAAYLREEERPDLYLLYVIAGSIPLLGLLFLCVLFPTGTADTVRDSRGDGHTRVRRAEVVGYLIGSAVAIALAVFVHLYIYQPLHELVHDHISAEPNQETVAQAVVSDKPNQETDSKAVVPATKVVLTRLDFHGFLHVSIFILVFSVIFLALLLSIRRLPAGLGICLVLNLVALAYFVTKVVSPSWNLPVVGGRFYF